jgi:hypothetical protein
MNNISEGTQSAQNILRTVQPTRSLFDPSSARLKYVRSEQTDIRRTWSKFARLARLQGAK